MERIGKILENENIILRKVEPEDIDFLYTVENNPDFWFVSETKAPFSRWQIKQHIESSVYDIYASKELRLIVESKPDNRKLGIIDLFDFDPFNMRVGIGIVICKEFQNQNIAASALEMVIDYAFKVLNVRQLWCNIDAGNIASINLFSRKFCFEHNGTLKSWKRNGDEFLDVYFYQLIRY